MRHRLAALLLLLVVLAPTAASRAEPRPMVVDPPPMRISIVRGDDAACPQPTCPAWISAEGQIDATAAARFRQALDDLGRDPPTVVINSRGGLVHEALAIGRMLRRAGATVIVGPTIFPYCGPTCAETGRLDAPYHQPAGVCDSSCVMILAGGAVRIAAPTTRVSVHRPSNVRVATMPPWALEPRGLRASADRVRRTLAERRPIADGDELIDRLRDYFREMGVADSVLALMLATRPAALRRLGPDELAESGLTGG